MHVTFSLKGENKNRINLNMDQTFTLTEANHVHCKGEVIINNVALRHSTHLYHKSDGSWVPSSQVCENARPYDDVYLYRINNYNDPSSGARSKAIQELPNMLSDLLQNMNQDELNALRKEAEQKYLKYRIASRTSDLEQKQKEVDELQKQIFDLNDRLDLANKGVF